MNRLKSLDYLRGLMALAVMFLHFHAWVLEKPINSEHLLGRLGIYGVSIFFILSGTAMYITSANSFAFTPQWIGSFTLRRILRIFPLLWAATFARMFILGMYNIPRAHLLLNLSGLFGFYDLDIAIARLAWSIGAELVFYTAMPLLLWLLLKAKPGFYLAFLVSMGLLCYYAFYVLDEGQSISSPAQWSNYMNPLNQILFFMAGMLIGFFYLKFKTIKPVTVNLSLLALCLIFIFYPLAGDRIALITDFPRLLFTALTIGICFFTTFANWNLPYWLHKPLDFLGEKSYGIYLIHPLVYELLAKRLGHRIHLEPVPLYLLCVVLTLVLSYASYKFFEKPINDLKRFIPKPVLSHNG